MSPPDEFEEGCNALLDSLAPIGVLPHSPGQPITTSFFRNSNLTQYGGKADIVMMGSTGSENTGQASGAAGLLASFGREKFGAGDMLSGNEVRQLLTMTAEDVRPLNTGVIGQPDKAEIGWDPHFGYGRVNLAAAMARIANKPHSSTPADQWPCQTTGPDADTTCVPPEAQIDSPDWFSPINVDRLPANGLLVRGRARTPRPNSGVGAWELEWACGQDAPDSSFVPIPKDGGGVISGRERSSRTARSAGSPRPRSRGLADNCDGSVVERRGPSRRPPRAGRRIPTRSPTPSATPSRSASPCTRLDDPANFGRYRKTLFAYNDDGNLTGWPKSVGEGSNQGDFITGSGGEVPPRLYDVDGDNELDIVLGDLQRRALRARLGRPAGAELQRRPAGAHAGALALASAGRIPAGLPTPHEPLRAPAIGDIDGDRRPEIVASAGEHVYAWHSDGSVVSGFPVRIDPDLSSPCLGVPTPCFGTAQTADDRAEPHQARHRRLGRARRPRRRRGARHRRRLARPALYAWGGDGDPLPAAAGASANGDGHYPVKLEYGPYAEDDEEADGAEIVTSPAIAELDDDGKADEVVLATNEVITGDPSFPTDVSSPFGLLNILISEATGSNPVYGVHGDGSTVDGWPVKVGVAAGDLLPLVLPGHDAAVLDADNAADGGDEVSVSAGTSLSSAQGNMLVDGNGATIRTYANAVTTGPDKGPILNLADYPRSATSPAPPPGRR